MNYRLKFALFILVFTVLFFSVRYLASDLYQAAHKDLGGIGWLFSTIGLIFSILSGFLIQHLWDKWERIQKVVLDEINALDHILLFGTQFPSLLEPVRELVREYTEHVIANEWSSKTKLLEQSEAILSLRNFSITSSLSQEKISMQDVSTYTRLINALSHARERRILLVTRRMPFIIKNTFILSAVLVGGLSLFVSIQSVVLDLIFTLSISSLVFSIYLIVDDMDSILSPGAWHVSSKVYREFSAKMQ